MDAIKDYFFVGIGGSGMMPLAMIVRAAGHRVAGSDRALDGGRLSAKFDALRDLGIALFPQDGSGITGGDQIVVASAAVEDHVPDIVAAREKGARRLSRAELLSALFNAAPRSIAIGGTSGKSTVTGMIGWILFDTGHDPKVMNGAIMKNFVAPDAPFASALVGNGDIFVSEVDESDGSIALYRPTVGVLNNVSLDHKSMDELRVLFGNFLSVAGTAVVNADDPEAAALAAGDDAIRYGLTNGDITADGITERADGLDAVVTDHRSGQSVAFTLGAPGRHNLANALAAIAACGAVGVPLADAAAALARFEGLRRRLERVGSAAGVTVIDDFAHNPDKIAATLRTLTAFPGRLLLFFQPHGYGPLAKMGNELVAAFAAGMRDGDHLILCDPVYFGGTVDRSTGSEAIVTGVAAAGRSAEHIPAREACGTRLIALARPGDRIIVMGARDDTLAGFARGLVDALIDAPAAAAV